MIQNSNGDFDLYFNEELGSDDPSDGMLDSDCPDDDHDHDESYGNKWSGLPEDESGNFLLNDERDDILELEEERPLELLVSADDEKRLLKRFAIETTVNGLHIVWCTDEDAARTKFVEKKLGRGEITAVTLLNDSE